MNVPIHKNKALISASIIILVTGLITSQNIMLSKFGYETQMHSFYNNYLIFKNSFFHLWNNENLYILYPEVQIDLFKYSPTFAFLFGPLSILPDYIGLFIWNLLNALVLVAVWKIPFSKSQNKIWVMAFLLIEYVTNIQSSQSNGLMAGLMILAYIFLERRNIFIATLLVALSVYIKLFGFVTFAIFLFYPNKLKAIGYSVFWFVVLFFLPLIITSPSNLIQQYQNWFDMLIIDKAVPYSPSVMGWLKSWFSINLSGTVLTLVGVLLFLIPFTQIKYYTNPKFKQLILSSVLMWVVLFNHKAESPTFIIAVSGIAIWYFSQKKSKLNTSLLFLVLIFTQLSPTDLFPSSVRSTLFIPYVIKVFPVILVWVKLTYDTFIVTQKNTSP